MTQRYPGVKAVPFRATLEITFGPGIFVNAFVPWGWGGISFGWRAHSIIVNNRLWERT